MGQEAVGNILEGLKIGQQRQDLQLRLAQEKAARDNELQLRQDTLDELKRQHDVENKRLDLQSKLTNQARQLQQLELQEKLNTGAYSGTPPAGETLMGRNTDEQGNTMETYTHPSIVDENGKMVPYMRADTATHNKMLEAQAKAKEGPVQDARLAEIKAQKDADEARARQNKADDMARSTKIEQDRFEHEKALKVLEANLKKNTVENFDPSPHVKAALEGRESLEELSKLPKDQKALVLEHLSQIGAQPISEKQKQFVLGLGGAVSAIPAMDEYVKNLNENPVTARVGVGTDASSKESTLRKRINEQLVQATGALMPNLSTRLSQPRIEAMSSAYGMSPTDKTTTNQLKREGYVRNLNDVFDMELGNLPAAQRGALRTQVGLPQPSGVSAQAPVNSPTHVYYDQNGQPSQTPPGGQQ